MQPAAFPGQSRAGRSAPRARSGRGTRAGGGRAGLSRGSAPPARAAPLRGSPLPKHPQSALLSPAAPHPGAVAGVPSGFAPWLKTVAEEGRGRDGRQRRHGGAEAPPAALRSAAPASKRAARSARQPPSPYCSLSAANLAGAPASQASAAATDWLFPGGLRAARMQCPERPSPPEPLDRNPGARSKVRGRRRAMSRQHGRRGAGPAPPPAPRQHPSEV